MKTKSNQTIMSMDEAPGNYENRLSGKVPGFSALQGGALEADILTASEC